MKEASKIAEKYDLFECDSCANEIASSLKSKGIKGKVLELDAGGPINVWHDGLGTNISTNGRHWAVEVDGMIIDNIHKQGIPKAQWKEQFHTIYGDINSFNIIESKF